MRHTLVTIDQAIADGLEGAAFLSIAKWHERAGNVALAAELRLTAYELGDREGLNLRPRSRPKKHHNENRRPQSRQPRWQEYRRAA